MQIENNDGCNRTFGVCSISIIFGVAISIGGVFGVLVLLGVDFFV